MENNQNLAGLGKDAERAFGESVRELRQAAGLSQADFAQRMNENGFAMHQTTVAKLEKGTRPTSIGEVVAIGAVLDVPGNKLLASWDAKYLQLTKVLAIQRRIDSLNQEVDRLRAEAKALASATTPDGITEDEWPGYAFEHGGEGDDGEHSEEA